MASSPWWNLIPLEDLSAEQWEQLCDGCAKCCLHKLIDDETDELHYTSVACSLLDCDTCRCRNYEKRLVLVPDCISVRQEDMSHLAFMPSTCAYRLRSENKPLPSWHPLETADPHSTHTNHMSVRGLAVPETDIPEEDWCEYVIDAL